MKDIIKDLNITASNITPEMIDAIKHTETMETLTSFGVMLFAAIAIYTISKNRIMTK